MVAWCCMTCSQCTNDLVAGSAYNDAATKIIKNRLQVLAASLSRRERRDGAGRGGGVKLLVLNFSLVPHESNMLTEY